ncbi:hypothetical protein [Dictyobacter kobayashii]|uniref:hypothetical protein n=1 Tax=Dictyobacter kobayashii TaxID=2014872 RepID=UPI0013869CEC|nr:hypothetical protein [Dictyobacter kobayashii]
MLKCLGESPFVIKGQNLSELLAQAYDQIRLTIQESMEHQVMIVESQQPAENGETSKL